MLRPIDEIHETRTFFSKLLENENVFSSAIYMQIKYKTKEKHLGGYANDSS